MKLATDTGSGKYEHLLERCRSLQPVPTAVAHPCEASALTGAAEAWEKKSDRSHLGWAGLQDNRHAGLALAVLH
jgi:hypothetical protein